MNIVTSLAVFTRPEVCVADQKQERQPRLDSQLVVTDSIDFDSGLTVFHVSADRRADSSDRTFRLSARCPHIVTVARRLPGQD
jgi:hypothetical protein